MSDQVDELPDDVAALLAAERDDGEEAPGAVRARVARRLGGTVGLGAATGIAGAMAGTVGATGSASLLGGSMGAFGAKALVAVALATGIGAPASARSAFGAASSRARCVRRRPLARPRR
jgi:hypothetical protein